jgi:hypothetical protein
LRTTAGISTRWRGALKLEPWEPDLRSLRDRVQNGDLDLQPDFQRGIVWSKAKQQKLVDTMLRGWAVPAIHLLVHDDDKLSVLDGQQRLTAMIAFMDNDFEVSSFLPHDTQLEHFVGKRFDDLPAAIQRRIYNFKVSSYRLYEYSPEEPHELFFRLNQPTGLTQAEKRNALIGGARGQAKQSGWSKTNLGFENARLAYDDIIARFCEYLEEGRLSLAVDASRMEVRYRAQRGYSARTIDVAESVIRSLGTYAASAADPKLRVNKATLLTWMLALARQLQHPQLHSIDINGAFSGLELQRRHRIVMANEDEELKSQDTLAVLYIDRASLRVADVLSVMSRDIALWGAAILPTALTPEELPSNMQSVLRAFRLNDSQGLNLTSAEVLNLVDAEMLSWGILR